MREINTPATAFEGDPRFSGSVSARHIAPEPDPQQHALIVHFAEGGRTAWHSHERGQLLIYIAGLGYVGARGGTVIELRPGFAAWTDAGERHWHGAGSHESMTQIAVQTETPGADGAEWKEAV